MRAAFPAPTRPPKIKNCRHVLPANRVSGACKAIFIDSEERGEWEYAARYPPMAPFPPLQMSPPRFVLGNEELS